MAKKQKFIGLTELEPSVVDMITNISEGPIRVLPTTGNFPAIGFIEKIYIAADTNRMYLWNGSTYIQLNGGGVEEMASIFEYTNLGAFPATGEIEKLYIAKDTNKIYRWNVSSYVQVGGVEIPLATTTVNGLMSAPDKVKLNGLTQPSQVTTSADGLMIAADKVKLNGVAASANNYTHPATDGNKHLPVNGTTNNNKVLKAGATAGTSSWGVIDASEVTATGGTNVQVKLDNIVTDARTATSEFRVEVRTSDPVSPAVGRIWIRSDL